jgi:hypothetical protein
LNVEDDFVPLATLQCSQCGACVDLYRDRPPQWDLRFRWGPCQAYMLIDNCPELRAQAYRVDPDWQDKEDTLRH